MRRGYRFAKPAAVRARLDAIAQQLREHEVDLAFLSEIVREAAPAPLDQVRYLAEAAGFHAWVYGDNYSFGLPFARIRAGNALLSRFPLRPGAVLQLPGARPFYRPTNNRRVVFGELLLGTRAHPFAVVRLDSFDLANNLRQGRALLAESSRDTLFGGDFNCEPGDAAFQLWRDSGRFAGVFDGPPTYPAHAPSRRIDTVLVPPSFGRVLEARVLDWDLSDHEPVLVTVELAGP